MKAALVNTQDGKVVNLVMVDSLSSVVPVGFRLVEVDTVTRQAFTPEEEKLIKIMKKRDPEYMPPAEQQERAITIGVTKWTEELGFHDEPVVAGFPEFTTPDGTLITSQEQFDSLYP